MAIQLVIENADLGGARGVIAPEALPEFEVRGWTVVGTTSIHNDPVTDDERAAAAAKAAAEEARVAALVAQAEADAAAAAEAADKTPTDADTAAQVEPAPESGDVPSPRPEK